MNKLFRKAAALTMAVAFLCTSVIDLHALGTGPVSPGTCRDTKDTQDEMRASAQKLYVVMPTGFSSHQSIDEQMFVTPRLPDDAGIVRRGEWDEPFSLEGVQRFLKKNGDSWQFNFLFGQTPKSAPSLVSIFQRCLQHAGFSSENTPIYVHDFPMGNGEVPLPRVVRYANGSDKVYVEIPRAFAVNFSRLLKNDFYIPINDGRFASLAQGLAYRLGRHEFAWKGKKYPKTGGHLFKDDNGDLNAKPNEEEAYRINGRYALYNEAIMLWYIFSFCQDKGVWFNNKNLKALLERITAPDNNDNQAIAFRTYFPELAEDRVRLKKAIDIALWINFHYFIEAANDFYNDPTTLDTFLGMLPVGPGEETLLIPKGEHPAANNEGILPEEAWQYRASGGTIFQRIKHSLFVRPEPDAKRIARLKKIHREQFKTGAEAIALAPGRANIIGEHVDYPSFDGQSGAVNYSLPFALPYSMLISGNRTTNNVVTLYSADFNDRFSFTLDELDAIANDPERLEALRRDHRWATYIMGLYYAARRQGLTVGGGNFVVTGNIPVGSGVSSSAAYSVAATLVLRQFYGWPVEGVSLARTARMAEHPDFNPFVGTKCGLLDQTASVMSETDKAVLINYGNMDDIRKVAFDLGDYAFVLVGSNVSRELAETAYNDRVRELEQVPAIMNRLLRAHVGAGYIDRTHVSAFTLDEFRTIESAFMAENPTLCKRARHVLTERARMLAFFEALGRGDIAACGRLLNESGDSLSMTGDFEISGAAHRADGSTVYALDELVKAGRHDGWAYGRMMGGGGGGCAIFLVKKDKMADWMDEIARGYEAATGFKASFYQATPSDGAHLVWRDEARRPQGPALTALEQFQSRQNIEQFGAWVKADGYEACQLYLNRIVREYSGAPGDIVELFRTGYIPYLLVNTPPVKVMALRQYLAQSQPALSARGRALTAEPFAQALASDEQASLETALEARDPRERRAALDRLAELFDEGRIVCAPLSRESNVHVHSKFSYSPYYPEAIAYWAKRAGLDTIGIIDHDTTAGCDDLMRAARILEQKATSGFEMRVSLPGTNFSDKVLNAPGITNMIYFLAHSLPNPKHPAILALLERVRVAKDRRNREMTNRINHRLAELAAGTLVVYDTDIAVLAEDGNCTDRHIAAGVVDKVNAAFSGTARETFYAKFLGKEKLSAAEKAALHDRELAAAMVRSALLKPGSAISCFIEPNEQECPPVAEVVKVIKEAGGIPVYPYLGDSKKNKSVENDVLDELFAYMKSIGVEGIAIMPDRNDKDEIAIAVAAAARHGLRIFSGVDINSVTQPFFAQKASVSEYPQFKDGADFLVGNEFLGRHAGVSYYSAFAQRRLPGEEERFGFFSYVGSLPMQRMMTLGGRLACAERQWEKHRIVSELIRAYRNRVQELRASRGLTGVIPVDRLRSGIDDERLGGLSEEALGDIEANERISHRALVFGISCYDIFVNRDELPSGTEAYRGGLALLGNTAGSIDRNGGLLQRFLDMLSGAEREEAYRDIIGGGPGYSTSRVLAQVSRRQMAGPSSFDVRFRSRAGRDAQGVQIRQDLRRLGIDVQIEESDRATAYTTVVEHSDNKRTFFHDVGASADFDLADITEEDFKGREVVEFGGIELGTKLFEHAEIALRLAKTLGKTPSAIRARCSKNVHGAITLWDTVVDNPGLWRTYFKDSDYRIFELIDVFAPSIGEACAIYGDAMSDENLPELQRQAHAKKIAEEAAATPEKVVQFFMDKGAKAVFLKLDTNGCYVKTAKDSIFAAETELVVPILPAFISKNKTGTGDAFAAGLMYASTAGWSPKKAAMFASVCGGMAVEQKGGTIGSHDFVDAMRYMDMYRELEAYEYVGISMGGTKALFEIKNGLRQTIGTPRELLWNAPESEGGFGERGNDIKNAVGQEEVVAALAREIQALVRDNRRTLAGMQQVYNCSAGPLSEIRERLGYPDPTPNLPFSNFPVMDMLARKLFGEQVDRLTVPVLFVLQHDGKGGVLGEFKEEPETSATTVIHGTGENFTAMKSGIYFTAGNAISECGHTSIGTPYAEEQGTAFPRHHYRFVGKLTGQNHPLQVVDEIPAEVRGTPRERLYILRADAEARVAGDEARERFIWQVNGEYDVEDLTSGGAIKNGMLKNKEGLAQTFGGTPAEYAELNSGADLSRAALAGNERAKQIIAYLAAEMGRALAAYIVVFRDEPFARNIRMVSTLGELLGSGVYENEQDEKDRRDIYLKNLQDAAEADLVTAGFTADDARTYARGITRSPGSADREITAAMPQVRPYTQPSDEELRELAPLVHREGSDYYVAEALVADAADLQRVTAMARMLGGKLKTYKTLGDLARHMRNQKAAQRACIDLAGITVTQEEFTRLITENPQLMYARFINSEVPDLTQVTEEDRAYFFQRVMMRMAIARSLEEKDVVERTRRYFLARYYFHPYMPIGFNVDDYIDRIVMAPNDDPLHFVADLIYVIKANLRYRPIASYDLKELKHVTQVLWSV